MGGSHAIPIPALYNDTVYIPPICACDTLLRHAEVYVAQFPDSNKNTLLPTFLAGNANNGGFPFNPGLNVGSERGYFTYTIFDTYYYYVWFKFALQLRLQCHNLGLWYLPQSDNVRRKPGLWGQRPGTKSISTPRR